MPLVLISLIGSGKQDRDVQVTPSEEKNQGSSVDSEDSQGPEFNKQKFKVNVLAQDAVRPLRWYLKQMQLQKYYGPTDTTKTLYSDQIKAH